MLGTVSYYLLHESCHTEGRLEAWRFLARYRPPITIHYGYSQVNGPFQGQGLGLQIFVPILRDTSRPASLRAARWNHRHGSRSPSAGVDSRTRRSHGNRQKSTTLRTRIYEWTCLGALTEEIRFRVSTALPGERTAPEGMCTWLAGPRRRRRRHVGAAAAAAAAGVRAIVETSRGSFYISCK